MILKGMKPDDKKAVVEVFESHGVWNVPWIRDVQSSFHIETKDLQNLRVCDKIALDKPEYLDLVGQYKQRLKYDMDTADVFDNYNKDRN